MSRPAGVTVSAIMEIAGSALVLLVGGLMVVALKAAPAARVPMPPGVGPLIAGTVVLMAACAALGAWTGIAMWKLRPWSRVSTLVFAGMLAAFSALSIVVMLALPTPPMPGAGQQVSFAAIQPILAGMYAVPLGIGVWWLVYFNRPSVRDAFAAPFVPGAPPARPLSISIIGWMGVVGSVMLLPIALTGWPAFFGGLILTGWSARLVYAALCALSAWLGWAVLKLRETGRRVMIGWYVFGIAQCAAVVLIPGVRARFIEVQQLMPFQPVVPGGMQSMTGAMATVIMGGVAVFGAVVIWFLVRERTRFS